MTTIVESVSTDISVLKTEVFDIEFARQLIDDDFISREEKDKIRRYLKNSIKNEHQTYYKLGKHLKNDYLGRLCAVRGESLQTFEKNVRGALASSYYWDIDMVNAQPTILQQYAEQNGWKTTAIQYYVQNREELLNEICDVLQIERWEAKDRIIALFFGSTYTDGLPRFFANDLKSELHLIMKNNWELNKNHLKFLERKPNHYGKALADILQTEERKCLLALEKALLKYNRSLDVFIHDGGLVRKLKDESAFPSELLPILEKSIFEQTGYSIKLHIKPLTTKYLKNDNNSELVPSNIIIDDLYSAREFAKRMGNLIVYDSGIIWVFDERTGIWSSKTEILERIVSNSDIVFKQMSPNGIKIYNYSGSVKNTKNLIIKLPSVLPIQNGYFRSRIHSDFGKILFVDGIYDFKTGQFTEGFDPNIVFHCAMPRKFPIRDQSKIDFIRNKSFIDPFVNIDDSNILLHNIMRALIGDYTRKKAVVGIGFMNSGKGMTTLLAKTAFGDLCSAFNGNSLLTRFEGGESSREMSWIADICYSRLAFSSEIRVPDNDKSKICIEGNMLKTIVSGGDEIRVRKLYQNDTSIINKSTLFIFANDMPRINPMSEEIRGRLEVCNWSYSYVDEPTTPLHKKKDSTLATLYSNPDYGDAFFWLLVEEYEKWRAINFAEPKTPECMLQGKDEIMPLEEFDYYAILSKKYVITKNPDDKVLSSEINDYLIEQGVTEKSNRVGRVLTALGTPIGKIKKDGKCFQVRLGIKLV